MGHLRVSLYDNGIKLPVMEKESISLNNLHSLILKSALFSYSFVSVLKRTISSSFFEYALSLCFISFLYLDSYVLVKLGIFHANQTSMCLDPHLN